MLQLPLYDKLWASSFQSSHSHIVLFLSEILPSYRKHIYLALCLLCRLTSQRAAFQTCVFVEESKEVKHVRLLRVSSMSDWRHNFFWKIFVKLSLQGNHSAGVSALLNFITFRQEEVWEQSEAWKGCVALTHTWAVIVKERLWNQWQKLKRLLVIIRLLWHNWKHSASPWFYYTSTVLQPLLFCPVSNGALSVSFFPAGQMPQFSGYVHNCSFWSAQLQSLSTFLISSFLL